MSEQLPPPRKGYKAISALAIIAILLGAFVLVPQFQSFVLNEASSIHIMPGGSYLGYNISSPSIQGNAAMVTYPPDYTVLENYTLGLINHDRYVNGLPPVTASSGAFAQQHANSMIYYGYFSHWDTQGYKPYMRYTLMGGNGAVTENIATQGWSGPYFKTTADVEGAISHLESQMMYNDSACCQNGHRDNILSPLHNEVAIGVAYNSQELYIVEDFLNQYIDLNVTTAQNYDVSMSGTFSSLPGSISQVWVLYDPTPISETPAQLNGGPESYGPGTPVGGVLPPCLIGCQTFANEATVYASEWSVSGHSLSISFSLSKFIAVRGTGVYTMYLLVGSDSSQTLTTISVFVTNP